MLPLFSACAWLFVLSSTSTGHYVVPCIRNYVFCSDNSAATRHLDGCNFAWLLLYQAHILRNYLQVACNKTLSEGIKVN